MNAAILCPGPSLARWKPETFKGYPLTLAVNRAVNFAPVGWWVFGDDTMFRQCPNVPASVNIFTIAEAPRRILKTGLAERLNAHTVTIAEDRGSSVPTSLGWRMFSATLALVLAHEEGATRIDVYGTDWTEDPDWDGVALPSNVRDAGRWNTERKIWSDVCDWIAPRGTTVHRLTP